MRTIRAVIKLMRPYTTLLAFLSILVPVFVRTHSLALGITLAAPMVFVSVCTFLLNDLDDVEKDKINHPERPLPRGEIAPVVVVTVYYISLASALFTIRFGIPDNGAAFLYYTLLTTAVSYGYVVEYLPTLKAPYVAVVSTLPVLILAAIYPSEPSLYTIAIALFSFNLGREFCRDIADRPGDAKSLLHELNANAVAAIAFVLQICAILLIGLQITTLRDLAVTVVMTSLIGGAYLLWFRQRRYFASTAIMKTVMYLGLYFLIS